MRIFAIGSNLAELIVDLKEPSENRPLIDQLNRDFGNLREVSDSMESAEAIVEPVVNRFCETLDAVTPSAADLQEKCTDLQSRLRRFSNRRARRIRKPAYPWTAIRIRTMTCRSNGLSRE